MNAGVEEVEEALGIFVVGMALLLAVAAVGWAAVEGAEPTRVVAVWVGVGKMSVALRDPKRTEAWAELVARTDTVVRVVT